MTLTESMHYHEFSPEAVIVDEDFDVEISLPEYNKYIETDCSNGNYYE